MGEGELKLLGAWASPFVIRVRLALRQKGLKYEYFEEDILNNKSELLLKYNPIHKKVPVLIHDNRSVCESSVILQYIDEAWSESRPSLLPTDPYERAMARFWADYINNNVFTWLGIVKERTEEVKAAKITETMSMLELLEETFKKCSKGKHFFGGDTIGFVDMTLGSTLTWLQAIEKVSGVKLLDETKFPKLVEWAERFLSEDCAKEVMPEVQKLEEYITKTLEPRWAAAASSK